MSGGKLHVLVAGDPASQSTINVLRQLGVAGSNVVVSFLPDLEFCKEEKQARNRSFVSEYLTILKENRLNHSLRKKGERFPVAKVEEWEIQAGLEAISKVDSINATFERVQFVPGNDFHIINQVNMLSRARKMYGSFDAVFIMFDYNKIFTAEGASNLIKICSNVNKNAAGKIKPFICFKGPFPQLNKKLSRMPLENVEICFMHPLSNTELFEDENQIVIVHTSIFEGDLEASLERCRSQGLNIESTFASSSGGKSKKLISATNCQDSATALVPMLLAWKSNECVSVAESPLFMEENRVNLVRDACSEVGVNDFISRESVLKVEGVLKKIYQPDSEQKMNSVQVAEEVSELRFILQEMINLSEKPVCKQIMELSESVATFPTELLIDPLRDQKESILEKL